MAVQFEMGKTLNWTGNGTNLAIEILQMLPKQY